MTVPTKGGPKALIGAGRLLDDDGIALAGLAIRRSASGPAIGPNVLRSASRCGPGSRSS